MNIRNERSMNSIFEFLSNTVHETKTKGSLKLICCLPLTSTVRFENSPTENADLLVKLTQGNEEL